MATDDGMDDAAIASFLADIDVDTPFPFPCLEISTNMPSTFREELSQSPSKLAEFGHASIEMLRGHDQYRVIRCLWLIHAEARELERCSGMDWVFSIKPALKSKIYSTNSANLGMSIHLIWVHLLTTLLQRMRTQSWAIRVVSVSCRCSVRP